MWHDYGDPGWGWMAFGMGLFWLVLIVVGIAVVSALLGGLPGKNTRGARPSARDLLDERLARGELDVADYQARCRALDEGRS
jgi:putative membrane protein